MKAEILDGAPSMLKHLIFFLISSNLFAGSLGDFFVVSVVKSLRNPFNAKESELQQLKNKQEDGIGFTEEDRDRFEELKRLERIEQYNIHVKQLTQAGVDEAEFIETGLGVSKTNKVGSEIDLPTFNGVQGSVEPPKGIYLPAHKTPARSLLVKTICVPKATKFIHCSLAEIKKKIEEDLKNADQNIDEIYELFFELISRLKFTTDLAGQTEITSFLDGYFRNHSEQMQYMGDRGLLLLSVKMEYLELVRHFLKIGCDPNKLSQEGHLLAAEAVNTPNREIFMSIINDPRFNPNAFTQTGGSILAEVFRRCEQNGPVYEEERNLMPGQFTSSFVHPLIMHPLFDYGKVPISMTRELWELGPIARGFALAFTPVQDVIHQLQALEIEERIDVEVEYVAALILLGKIFKLKEISLQFENNSFLNNLFEKLVFLRVGLLDSVERHAITVYLLNLVNEYKCLNILFSLAIQKSEFDLINIMFEQDWVNYEWFKNIKPTLLDTLITQLSPNAKERYLELRQEHFVSLEASSRAALELEHVQAIRKGFEGLIFKSQEEFAYKESEDRNRIGQKEDIDWQELRNLFFNGRQNILDTEKVTREEKRRLEQQRAAQENALRKQREKIEKVHRQELASLNTFEQENRPLLTIEEHEQRTGLLDVFQAGLRQISQFLQDRAKIFESFLTDEKTHRQVLERQAHGLEARESWQTLTRHLQRRQVPDAIRGAPLLYEAVYFSNLHLIRMLLEQGSDPEACFRGYTPLSLAIHSEEIEHRQGIIEALIKNRKLKLLTSSCCLENGLEYAPANYAIKWKKLDSLKIILDQIDTLEWSETKGYYERLLRFTENLFEKKPSKGSLEDRILREIKSRLEKLLS